MGTFVLFCSALLAALLEATFFVPFAAIIVVILSVVRVDSLPFFFGFISGVFLDLLLVRPLGASSALFLCIAIVIMLYKRKFDAHNIFFVFLSAILSLALYLLLANDFTFDFPKGTKVLLFACFTGVIWIFSKKARNDDEAWS